MSKPRLVDDLIPEILSWSTWWPRDLLRVTTVSRSWLFYARKLLYYKPSLHSFPALRLFARSIQNNPTVLLPLINGIELCPTTTGFGQCLGFGAEEARAARIILGIKGLKSVCLGGELAVCAERFLNCLDYSHSVEELTVDGSLIADSLSLCTIPSFEWDEIMACKFSRVQKLRFSYIGLDIVYPASPYQLQLTDLALDHVDILSGNLQWLLQETSTLKHLRVSGESSPELDEHVALVLESYRLESLHYQVGSSPSWNLSLFDRELAAAVSLRSLHLDGVRVDSELLRSIHARCPAMEQLYISGRYVPLTREDWIGCIASGLFPALRKLGLPEGTFSPPFTRWTASLEPTLQKVCSRRGVSLLC
ncbi:hypothetical protein GYMLUDRAFT_33370 [Collybiopsis luxurians FD-317 M1]|nr:hypothetical protein GYMLUDRAFT_33370 [Collybiopsis luxurians FD-317 M1]